MAAAAKPRLPDLGPRGEGWVIGQLVLIGLLVVLGLPRLPDLWPVDLVGWLAFFVGVAALGLGAWMVIRAVQDLGSSLTALPRPRDDAQFVESGIYARIRHPIYAGLILAALGWSLLTRSVPALGAALALALFLDAKARREEAWLIERYASYPAYRLRSKRFVPSVY
jgi:protein-S-isoprenylcysteine O-methyltransferase Ste14